VTARRRIAPLPTLALVAWLGLGGCATSGQIGRPFDPAARHKLALGWTTRGEVRHLLGEPTSVAPGPNGTETWVYEHTQVSALTIPLYGIVHARQTPHRILTIRFEYGLVADCTLFEERYASRGLRLLPGRGSSDSCLR
jgi:outer membrane protein assembly factor BamE (lipoprotein component of BamABCDE complex)